MNLNTLLFFILVPCTSCNGQAASKTSTGTLNGSAALGLWLGTHEAGAYKFNGQTFEKFKF